MRFLHDFGSLDKTFRTNLINGLSGFKSPLLIGSRDGEGHLNVAVFSSVFHLGANPPLMGFINRPDSVPRDTLENIRQTGHYTFNHLPQRFREAVHHTSARYPQSISEFRPAGLSPQMREGHAAPFVAEAEIQIALECRDIVPIPHNGTWLVIGEVKAVWIVPERLSEDGTIELTGTPAVVGLDAYYSVEPLERLPYAKPLEP
jgi:flavin reductase (DIM6/NTAB) family NADH-FMN oxidoreductase RutF